MFGHSACSANGQVGDHDRCVLGDGKRAWNRIRVGREAAAADHVDQERFVGEIAWLADDRLEDLKWSGDQFVGERRFDDCIGVSGDGDIFGCGELPASGDDVLGDRARCARREQRRVGDGPRAGLADGVDDDGAAVVDAAIDRELERGVKVDGVSG